MSQQLNVLYLFFAFMNLHAYFLSFILFCMNAREYCAKYVYLYTKKYCFMYINYILTNRWKNFEWVLIELGYLSALL